MAENHEEKTKNKNLCWPCVESSSQDQPITLTVVSRRKPGAAGTSQWKFRLSRSTPRPTAPRRLLLDHPLVQHLAPQSRSGRLLLGKPVRHVLFRPPPPPQETRSTAAISSSSASWMFVPRRPWILILDSFGGPAATAWKWRERPGGWRWGARRPTTRAGIASPGTLGRRASGTARREQSRPWRAASGRGRLRARRRISSISRRRTWTVPSLFLPWILQNAKRRYELLDLSLSFWGRAEDEVVGVVIYESAKGPRASIFWLCRGEWGTSVGLTFGGVADDAAATDGDSPTCCYFYRPRFSKGGKNEG